MLNLACQSWRILVLACAGVSVGLLARSAVATPPTITPQSTDASDTDNAPNTGGLSNTFFAGVSRSAYALGDMGGFRTFLSKYGMSINITETSEVLGNATGGAGRGIDYDGLTQMDFQLDTQRAFGLHGGTFNVSGLQIHGRNLSADHLLTIQTASGIESDRSTRLWELWYQQSFLEEDRLDVKIGQQSLDQEFMVSQNALLFVNTMFGWPAVPSYDMPGGGPAYPLSALGVRARYRPNDAITILAGVFNGSPVSDNTGDPQLKNQSGTSFPLDGGVLAIAEIQYAYPSVGSMVYADESEPLARTYRLGVWYDSESFADQQFATNGVSLASPASNGTAQTHHGNFGIYGVVDQMLWHSDDDPDHSLNFFTRVIGTPQTDRNLVEFSANIGLTLLDPIPHRDDDSLGLGLGYVHVSSSASGLDRDTANFSGLHYPVRSDETFIELTYQYQLTPWCQLQPDFQYVFNPGAGVPNPNSPGERVKDEAVFGLRANILF
jgi:porin